MRVLWLSCLLIGSITCVPVRKDYRSNNAGTSFMQPPLSYGHMFSGEGMSSSPGSSSPLPSLSSPSFGKAAQLPAPQSSGYVASAPGGSYGGGYGSSASGYGASAPGGSYGGGYGGYGSSASGYGASAPGGSYGGGYGSSASGYGASAPGGSYGGGYGSSASGYVGDSYGYVAPQDESSNSGSAISDGAGYENPEPVFSDVSDLEPVYSYSSRSSYQRGQAVFAQTRYTPEEPVPPFPLSRRSSKATLQPNAPAKTPTKGGF